MTFSDYVNTRWGTVPLMTQEDQELAYIGLGVAGEAGEVADEIKKRLRKNGNLRDPNLLLCEVGDVLFYIERLLDYFGVTQEYCIELLKEKLSVRERINFQENPSIPVDEVNLAVGF